MKTIIATIALLLSTNVLACTVEPINVDMGNGLHRITKSDMQGVFNVSITCPAGAAFTITTASNSYLSTHNGMNTNLQLFKASDYLATSNLFNNPITGTGTGLPQSVPIFVQISGASGDVWLPVNTFGIMNILATNHLIIN